MVDYIIIDPGWTCIISDRDFVEKLKKHYKGFKPLKGSSYKILSNGLNINITDEAAYLWRSDRKITDREVKALIDRVMRK